MDGAGGSLDGEEILLQIERNSNKKANEKAKQESGSTPYDPTFLSSNAISLRNGLQLILRFYGEPSEIHSTFDFTHCTCYWVSETKELVTPEAALLALMSKTLIYQGSLYPLASVVRIRKFIQRGYRINAGQILKIAIQLSKLDLTDPKVLEDQLTGVDVAYFADILERVSANDPVKIDSGYLVQVIDELIGG